MELDYQAIGVRVRRFRKLQGLTQQALAERSDQEPSNISHIERGATKLSLPTLVSLANALAEYYSLRVSASLLLKVVPYVVMVAVLSIASIVNRRKVRVRGAFSD